MECRVRGTGKVQVQMRDGSSFVLDNVRQDQGSDQKDLEGLEAVRRISEWVKDQEGSPSAIGFKTPINMLGLFGWLASIKQGMLEPVKVKCILLGYRKGIVGNKNWRLDDVTSKVVLYRNMGFNESGKYKKTFIDFGVGTGSMQVLHRFEFEVEPLEDHTFEVKPQENVDQGADLQEVQTQDLMDYQLAHDREQYLACELFGYREDSNKAAFVVAAADKIYAHESLTFNDIVACKVISKWNAELKEDMDVRSNVYVLSNGYKKSSDDNHDYYWEYAPGDYDVEKNGKWSYICSWKPEYQVVCTRPDIALADVDMLDGLIVKKEIWLKGLLTESGYELRLVASIDTGALVKVYSRSKVPAHVKVVAYRLIGVQGLDIKGSRNKQEVRMKALLEQQGLAAALEELPAITIVAYDNVIQTKAYSALILCLGDRVLREITKEMTEAGYMTLIEVVKEAIWINGLLT
ncbi:hypothetical protein Tco_0199199 [Tanacetum coccineum]